MPSEMSLLNGRLLDSVLSPDRESINTSVSNLASQTSSDKPFTLARLHKFQFKAQIKQSSNMREQVPNRDDANHEPSWQHADNWKWCESFTVARLPKFEHCYLLLPLHDAFLVPSSSSKPTSISLQYPSISRNPVNTIRARMQKRPHSLSRTSPKRTTANTTTCNTTRVGPTSTTCTTPPHQQATLPVPFVAEVASGLSFFALCLLYAVALLVLARFLRVPLLGRFVAHVLQVEALTEGKTFTGILKARKIKITKSTLVVC